MLLHPRLLCLSTVVLIYLPLSCEAFLYSLWNADSEDDESTSFRTADGDATTNEEGGNTGPSPPEEDNIVTITYELQVEENAGDFCSFDDLLIIGERLWMDQWGDDYDWSATTTDYSPTILSQSIMHDEHELDYYDRRRALVLDEQQATELGEQNVIHDHPYRYAASISFPVPRTNRPDDRSLRSSNSKGIWSWSDYWCDVWSWSHFGGWSEQDYGGGGGDEWNKTSIDTSLLTDFSCFETVSSAWLVPIRDSSTTRGTGDSNSGFDPFNITHTDGVGSLGFSVSFFGSDDIEGTFCSHEEIAAIGEILKDILTFTDSFGESGESLFDHVWPLEQDITRVQVTTTIEYEDNATVDDEDGTSIGDDEGNTTMGDEDSIAGGDEVNTTIMGDEGNTTVSGEINITGDDQGNSTIGTSTYADYIDYLTIFYQALTDNITEVDSLILARRRRKLATESHLSGSLSEAINFEINFEIGKLIGSEEGFECLVGTRSVEVQIITADTYGE